MAMAELERPHVVRKDAQPAATIARIRAILAGVAFRPDDELVTCWQPWDDCFSCHLRFGSYPLLFANGKGVFEELALASALGEHIERLECRLDLFFGEAGNTPEEAILHGLCEVLERYAMQQVATGAVAGLRN